MTSDLDTYRSAHELIKQYGKDAPLHAAMRADELLENGDVEARAVWMRILRAVEELLLREPPGGTVTH